MKRLLLSLSVVGAAMLVAGAAAVRGSDAPARHPAVLAAPPKHVVKTIVYHAREPFPPRFFDVVKPRGPSSGDEGVEKEILTRHGLRIGRDLLHFSVVTADRRHGPEVVVDGVIILRGGQVAVQGATTFRHIRVAVVGGTGVYQGVSGQLTVLRTLAGDVDLDSLRLVMP